MANLSQTRSNIRVSVKVSLLGVDSGILGFIVVDLCYFALFEDFLLQK